jgi:hypothetical protein
MTVFVQPAGGAEAKCFSPTSKFLRFDCVAEFPG